MANILVTDGEQRASLAIVRSLGQAGYRCFVCSSSGKSLAGRSRYAYREVRVPDPAASPAEFAAGIGSQVDVDSIDVVLPVSEASLLAVLAARETIAAEIPFPDLETFRAVCDKRRVLSTAHAVGIRVPGQWVVGSAADVRARQIQVPVVLKPTRSVFTAPDGTKGKVGVTWVHSAREMEAALQAYPEAAYPVLAQQPISGPGIGVFVLVHEGRCIARFSHRRIREKPPTGGVSVVSQSEPMDESLLDRSLALLQEFGWSGVAMVEYKRDAVTGEPVLMEINGRFWGSLQLAINAGVDFPRLLVDAALGLEVTPIDTYGFVRSRWLWGDVDNLIARWRAPSATWGGRMGTVLEWLRACGPGYVEDVFRWHDPRPFVHESSQWIRDLGRQAGD
jgi:predicted ATP-grasp superfamily ATP-dependent carboligase